MDRSIKNELLQIPGVRELVEVAFRRGFAHASYWAVEAASDKLSHAELLAWHENVTKWRYDSIDKERHSVLRGSKAWRIPPEPWQFAFGKKKGSK